MHNSGLVHKLSQLDVTACNVALRPGHDPAAQAAILRLECCKAAIGNSSLAQGH